MDDTSTAVKFECADFLEKIAFGDFEGAMGWKVIGPQDGPLILARVTAAVAMLGFRDSRHEND